MDDVETEIEGLEEQGEEVLKDVEETIGGFSDLRYGRFNRISDGQGGEIGVEEKVVEALKEITNIARQKTGTSKG